jgi:hypothetical protein
MSITGFGKSSDPRNPVNVVQVSRPTGVLDGVPFDDSRVDFEVPFHACPAMCAVP